MSGHGWHPHIESALALDIRRMAKSGVLRNGARGTWAWTDSYGEQVGSVGYTVALDSTPGIGPYGGTLTLDYTHTDRDSGERKPVTCTIRLFTTQLHYGGRRWYVACPYAGRRALKLYKFSGIEQFCHRTAIRPLPTYASQRMSGSGRIMAQRWAIRRKLGDNFSTLFDEPFKPKWMRWATFEKYAMRDAELAARGAPYFARLLGRLGVDEIRALADEWGG